MSNHAAYFSILPLTKEEKNSDEDTFRKEKLVLLTQKSLVTQDFPKTESFGLNLTEYFKNELK